MRRVMFALAAALGLACLAPAAEAQYVIPYSTYYAPTVTYSAPVYSQPVYSSYYPGSYTSYYAPAATTVVSSAPAYSSYYAPTTVSSYYAPTVSSSYYAPTVTYSSPTVVYRPYTVASPVVSAPVVAAPVVTSPAYVGRVKTYYPLQPVRNVIRAVTPGVPVYAY